MNKILTSSGGVTLQKSHTKKIVAFLLVVFMQRDLVLSLSFKCPGIIKVK